MFRSSALDSCTIKPRAFSTLVRLKVCPGSFDLAQRAGAGLQDENGGLRGPEAAACDGLESCDLQTYAGDGELMGCGRLEVGCPAGQHFNSHLQLPLLTPSHSLFFGSVESDFRGEGSKWQGYTALQRSMTGDMGREMDRREAKKG